MQSILAHARENRDLTLLLRSPIISADKKHAALNSLYKGKVDDLTMKFIDLTIHKGREVILVDIAAQFVAEYYNFNGIVRATLTTAVEIKAELKDKIKAQVEAETKKSVEINEQIDKDIIGGYVLEYDNKLLDASVSHQLNQIRNKFSKNEFIKTI
jgi:F-type H+-transporting ATPase subunit delta